MQTSKLILMGIMSQSPHPYVVTDGPDMTLGVEADCHVIGAYNVNDANDNPVDVGDGIQSFYVGLVGILRVSLINQGTTPVMVQMPETVEFLDLPYGWDDPFPILQPGDNILVSCDFVVTGNVDDSVTFVYPNGCPNNPNGFSIYPTPQFYTWKIGSDFTGATSIDDVEYETLQMTVTEPSYLDLNPTDMTTAVFDGQVLKAVAVPFEYGKGTHSAGDPAGNEYRHAIAFNPNASGEFVQVEYPHESGSYTPPMSVQLVVSQFEMFDESSGDTVDRVIASYGNGTLSLGFRASINDPYTMSSTPLVLEPFVEHVMTIKITTTQISVIVDDVEYLLTTGTAIQAGRGTEVSILVATPHIITSKSTYTLGASSWQLVDLFTGTEGEYLTHRRTLTGGGIMTGTSLSWFDTHSDHPIRITSNNAVAAPDVTNLGLFVGVNTPDIELAGQLPFISVGFTASLSEGYSAYGPMPYIDGQVLGIGLQCWSNANNTYVESSFYIFEDRMEIWTWKGLGGEDGDTTDTQTINMTVGPEPVPMNIQYDQANQTLRYYIGTNMVFSQFCESMNVTYMELTLVVNVGIGTQVDNIYLQGSKVDTISDIPYSDSLYRLWDMRSADSTGVADKIIGQRINFNQTLDFGQELEVVAPSGPWKQQVLRAVTSNSGNALGQLADGGFTNPEAYTVIIIGRPTRDYTGMASNQNVDVIMNNGSSGHGGAGLNQMQYQGLAVRGPGAPGYSINTPTDWRSSRMISIRYDPNESGNSWVATSNGAQVFSGNSGGDVFQDQFTHLFPTNSWSDTDYELGIFAVYNRALSYGEILDIWGYVQNAWLAIEN